VRDSSIAASDHSMLRAKIELEKNYVQKSASNKLKS
jgi:hypothetical protein